MQHEGPVLELIQRRMWAFVLDVFTTRRKSEFVKNLTFYTRTAITTD